MRDGEVATTETSAVNYSAVRIVAPNGDAYSATSKLCSLRFPPPGQVPAAYELDRHLPLAFSASGLGTEKQVLLFVWFPTRNAFKYSGACMDALSPQE